MTMTLLTQKQYAKRLGVTPQYVNKLVRSGKIGLRSGKINPREADLAIAATRRAGRVLPAQRKAAQRSNRASKAKAKRPARKPAAGRPAGRPPDAAPPAEGRRGSATASLTAARAKREFYLAEMAKLDHGRMSGELLPAGDVLEAQRRQNANLRTRFRRLARSLAPVLAMKATPAEVEAALGDEIDALLRELAADPLGAAPAAPEPETPAPGPEAPPPSPSLQTFAQEGAAA